MQLTSLMTRSGKHALRLRIADTFFSRLAGLLFSGAPGEDEGLVITHCKDVHTIGMRSAIDVVFLSQDGTVLKCIANLRPFRAAWCKSAASTLELAAGAIARYGIAPGDRLALTLQERKRSSVPITTADSTTSTNSHGKTSWWRGESGATLVEFVVVAPLITLLGMGGVEFGLLFFAKNNFNHASFMAARAGSTGNANLSTVRDAYTRALIPQFGGGTNAAELQASYLKAQDSVKNVARIELLNPTKGSFDDWNDTVLQNTLGRGKRVIPNDGLRTKSLTDVRSNSGQSIHDANLIKLRITHGYEPKVPVVGRLVVEALKLFDDRSDSFKTALYNKARPGGGTGFIPVVMDVTLKMQSDAIESDEPVLLPDPGNGGNPPAEPPPSPPPPGDAPPDGPPGGGGPINPGVPCVGAYCQICSETMQSAKTNLPADILFEFDQFTLTPDGRAYLDNLINQAQGITIASMTITGYTDQIGGNSQHNMDLSLKRAQAVKDYLVSKGLQLNNIQVIGKGPADPIKHESECPGTLAQQKACLADNRRVTVQYTYYNDPT